MVTSHISMKLAFRNQVVETQKMRGTIHDFRTVFGKCSENVKNDHHVPLNSQVLWCSKTIEDGFECILHYHNTCFWEFPTSHYEIYNICQVNLSYALEMSTTLRIS